MPPCAICEDSYESPPYICKRCRRDPANADWIKHVDGEADQSEATYVVEQWRPDETDRKIARAILLGDTSLRGAAREAGCSLTRVQSFVKRVMTSQPESFRVWPAALKRTEKQIACEHTQGKQRTDLGAGCYTCVSCGLPGRRSLASGQITFGVRHPGYRRPPLTVDFKPLNEPPTEANEARARLRKTHSNRHDNLFDYDDLPEDADE